MVKIDRLHVAIVIVIMHSAFVATINYIYGSVATDQEAMAAWRILLLIDYPTSLLYRPIDSNFYSLLGILHWLAIWIIGTMLYDRYHNLNPNSVGITAEKPKSTPAPWSPPSRHFSNVFHRRTRWRGSSIALTGANYHDLIHCYRHRLRNGILGIVFAIAALAGLCLQPWKIDETFRSRKQWQTTTGWVTGNRVIIDDQTTNYHTEIQYVFDYNGRWQSGREHLPGDPRFASRREATRYIEEYLSPDMSITVYYDPDSRVYNNGLENRKQPFLPATTVTIFCIAMAIAFLMKARSGYRIYPPPGMIDSRPDHKAVS